MTCLEWAKCKKVGVKKKMGTRVGFCALSKEAWFSNFLGMIDKNLRLGQRQVTKRTQKNFPATIHFYKGPEVSGSPSTVPQQQWNIIYLSTLFNKKTAEDDAKRDKS